MSFSSFFMRPDSWSGLSIDGGDSAAAAAAATGSDDVGCDAGVALDA